MANDTLIDTDVRRSPAQHLAAQMEAASVAGRVSLREIAFTTQISTSPSRLWTNASRSPAGDQLGTSS